MKQHNNGRFRKCKHGLFWWSEVENGNCDAYPFNDECIRFGNFNNKTERYNYCYSRVTMLLRNNDE